MAKIGFKIEDRPVVAIVQSGIYSLYFGIGRPIVGYSNGSYLFDDCISKDPVEIPDKDLPINLHGLGFGFRLVGSGRNADLYLVILKSLNSRYKVSTKIDLNGMADVSFDGTLIKGDASTKQGREHLLDILHVRWITGGP